MIFLQDGEVLEVAGVGVFGEMPAIGGDDDGGFASEPVQMRVGREEGGKDGPLGIGEASLID